MPIFPVFFFASLSPTPFKMASSPFRQHLTHQNLKDHKICPIKLQKSTPSSIFPLYIPLQYDVWTMISRDVLPHICIHRCLRLRVVGRRRTSGKKEKENREAGFFGLHNYPPKLLLSCSIPPLLPTVGSHC